MFPTLKLKFDLKFITEYSKFSHKSKLKIRSLPLSCQLFQLRGSYLLAEYIINLSSIDLDNKVFRVQ